MGKLAHGVLLLSLAATPGLAGTVLFQGTFSADNQVALFSFTANSPESITFQTYGYAGGVAPPATVVPAGGFAPTAFIFDSMGNVFPLSNGSCGQVNADPTTGNCDDLLYTNTFGPGAFTLALAVLDNRPVDNILADGFIQDGNPGFTCQEFGISGSFCDVTTALGTSRTGDWALTVTGADLASQVGVPEPGTLIMVSAAGALAMLLRRFRSKFPER